MKYFLLLAGMFILATACATEHGGKSMKSEKAKEHGGKTMEHGGKGMDKDDCTTDKDGKETCVPKKNKKDSDQGRTKFMKDRKVSIEEIKSALTTYIKKQSDKNGVYQYLDADRNNRPMKLRFVKIHDPVRHMEKKGQYFACTDFEVVGKAGKLHDMDFWMVPTATGLEVVSTKVHKDPVKKSRKWVKVPRYTFKGEEIVKLNQ